MRTGRSGRPLCAPRRSGKPRNLRITLFPNEIRYDTVQCVGRPVDMYARDGGSAVRRPPLHTAGAPCRNAARHASSASLGLKARSSRAPGAPRTISSTPELPRGRGRRLNANWAEPHRRPEEKCIATLGAHKTTDLEQARDL